MRTMLGRPIVQLTPREGSARLLDLHTGHRVTPVNRLTAIAVAREALGPRTVAVVATRMVTEPSRAYPGPLPAWRVDFDDEDRTQVYVAADLGRVTAIRNSSSVSLT